MSAAHQSPRAGERFLIGVPMVEMTDSFRLFCMKHGFSDFILFAHNCISRDQLAALTGELHAIALANRATAALIAIDQEGGRVQRLPKDIISSPAARTLASCGENAVFDEGFRIGHALRALGINFDLAPVLDVDEGNGSEVIGDRSFATTPQDVARFGVSMARGLLRAGVLACAKHFPGHGGTRLDSHVSLPAVDLDIDALLSAPLVPFAAAIDSKIPAVMSAHIMFPSIDPDVPATMSKLFLTDILRKRLGFSGLVLTDDLEMGAIAAQWSGEEAACASLCAGADMALVSHSIELAEKALDGVEGALRDGILSHREHESSYARKLEAIKWLDM